jgi:hypothetical protein
MTAAVVAAQPSTRPDDQSKQEMIDKMNAMQAQMGQMQAQLAQTQAQLKQTQTQIQQDNQATLDTQAQTKAIGQLIQDADKQSRVFSSMPGNAGFDIDHGFYIDSDDGQSHLHPGILFEPLASRTFTSSPRNDGSTTGIVQFDIDGTVFSKDVSFNFVVNQGSIYPLLEYAELGYVFAHDIGGHDLGLEVGQFKEPIYKEATINGDPNQLLVLPSLASDLLGSTSGPDVQGGTLEFVGDGAPLHASMSVDSGPTGGIGSTLLTPTTGTPTFGASLRLDYKFFGDWRDTTDLTGRNWGKNNLLDIGGGVAYDNDNIDNLIRGTIDAQYLEAQTFTIFGALYGDYDDYNHSSTFGADDRSDFGATIQGGVFLSRSLEFAARYSVVAADTHFKALTGGQSVFNEITLGGNYFFGPDGDWANHLKLSIDVAILPDGTPGDPALLFPALPKKTAAILRGGLQLWF